MCDAPAAQTACSLRYSAAAEQLDTKLLAALLCKPPLVCPLAPGARRWAAACSLRPHLMAASGSTRAPPCSCSQTSELLVVHWEFWVRERRAEPRELSCQHM